ncbi:MAG: haloacid dehalogenase [Candidatus Thermoplasmatota archaeon]
MNLDEIAKEIMETLDAKEAVREEALRISRAVVRGCKSAIRAVVEGRDASEILTVVEGELRQVKALTAPHPEIEHAGYVADACREYVEAVVLRAIVSSTPLPTPRALGVSEGSYIEGVGDAIGELRRIFLSAVIEGDLDRAKGLLAAMESLYEFLLVFDYPSAMVGVRRKQDVARGILERSRGEMAVAVRTMELERALEARSV